MMTRALGLSFTTRESDTLLRYLERSNFLSSGPPTQATVNAKPWVKGLNYAAMMKAGDSLMAYWYPNTAQESFMSWWKKGCIKIETSERKANIAEAGEYLQKIPFELCAGRSISTDWGGVGRRIEYSGFGFSDGHWNHGWMCAFKGKGHDRLVSRRWLDYGPWRLIRDETHDLSIVQFHDLNADDDTALAQAKPGHERMGISETGGFIQTDFVWRYQQGASYDPAEQRLFYVVYGRDVKPREMLEAAAVKLWQPLAKPVKQVAYVFMDEKAARAHVHEAWLHNVEVRTFVNGAEVILTETYDPPAPKVPDWVKRLQDQEGK